MRQGNNQGGGGGNFAYVRRGRGANEKHTDAYKGGGVSEIGDFTAYALYGCPLIQKVNIGKEKNERKFLDKTVDTGHRDLEPRSIDLINFTMEGNFLIEDTEIIITIIMAVYHLLHLHLVLIFYINQQGSNYHLQIW